MGGEAAYQELLNLVSEKLGSPQCRACFTILFIPTLPYLLTHYETHKNVKTLCSHQFGEYNML